MRKLIADSGSTKTAWAVLSERQDVGCQGCAMVESAGINPVRDSKEEVYSSARQVLQLLEKKGVSPDEIGEVDFYGAGCIPPYADAVRQTLVTLFPQAEVAVESDLLGAARALCGHSEGIACILGTGSNSCYYDGRKIVDNVSPLGWILGDEGSGAVLGRLLVGDVLKGQFSPAVCEAFYERFQLTRADIIEAVYRKPQPNRFLASLVPFLAEKASETSVHALLVHEFRRFFVRNVAAYKHPELPVHFVGGVAHQFASELTEAAEHEGFKVGLIERSPIHKMMAFHAG